jgi:BolA family transcriptional regulator, general stress-responsive regulator
MSGRMRLGERGRRISGKLEREFSPSELQVIDESSQHAGHAGSRPGGETHFRVHIRAAAFNGKSRIERHRMIHRVLAEELADGVHALAISAYGPDDGKS